MTPVPLLQMIRVELETRRARVETIPEPLERARTFLSVGDSERALEVLTSIPPLPARNLLLLETRLARSEFVEAEPLLGAVRFPADDAARELLYEWLVVTDDLATLEARTKDRLREDASSVVDRLAAGSLRLAVLDPSGAEAHFQNVETRFAASGSSGTRSDRRRHAAALAGLAKVAHRRLQFERAEELTRAALALDPLEADHLVLYAEVLIRLGRVEPAIDALMLAVEIAPLHETAHYYLGNGYAEKSYTQLQAAYPAAVGDSTAPAAALVRAGSEAFAAGRFREARGLFLESLRFCPEYGRAHNGLAKAIEGERLLVEVHRRAYEEAFAAAPFPEIPRLEEFVINWHALGPRHQKRVALSIAPWRRYLPALIAGGHTYYIKPLHELLSETPGQETLRDQRIDYDSRLWDDVRGCGGYHTVTGLEDVERSVLGRYDTVLHELTHQVHGVLPRETVREIEDLYRRTKERDGGTGQAFMSRYAGGSVWEYFAEGANALGSPRRDRYDTREIVRERLEALDPTLQALVRRLEEEAPVEACLPVALVNRGHHALERGDPEEALRHYAGALAVDPREPNALGARVHGLLVASRPDSALRRAEEAVLLHPDDGNLALLAASAARHAGRSIPEVIARLEAARTRIREEDQLAVDLELGRLHWLTGSAAASLAAYDRALARQQDHPEGRWGRANAEALAGRWDEAWAAFEAAIRMRNGILALRLDFARELLRAGDRERAGEEIAAAELLDPEDPFVRAFRAWTLLDSGNAADAEAAWRLARDTAREFDWCLLAKQVESRAEFLLGRMDEARARLAEVERRAAAPPSFVYRPKQGRYDEIGIWPRVEQRLSEAGGPLALE